MANSSGDRRRYSPLNVPNSSIQLTASEAIVAMYLVAHKEVETSVLVRYGLYNDIAERIGELVFDPVSGFIVHEDDDRPVVGFVGIAARLVVAHYQTGATPESIVHAA